MVILHLLRGRSLRIHAADIVHDLLSSPFPQLHIGFQGKFWAEFDRQTDGYKD
ncbi:MAG: hypothetical protein N2235_21965 [Fischerella sp.]|nr:hypothetical protein [Fischerella sp.]